jgi:hypothetical protein
VNHLLTSGKITVTPDGIKPGSRRGRETSAASATLRIVCDAVQICSVRGKLRYR